jgi:Flp pilus assembly protein TadD
MRLLVAKKAGAPRPTTATALAKRFFRLGDRYMQKNQLPEAERSLRRAITMRPDWATAWNSLGVSVVRQGRVDDAAPLLEQCILLNSKYALGLTNLADVRRVQGKLTESMTLAKRAVDLNPKDSWTHIVYGHACFANNDFATAEAQYRAALEIDPGSGVTHADLAGALLREGKKAEATQEASRALELGCQTHWVYKEIGMPK